MTHTAAECLNLIKQAIENCDEIDERVSEDPQGGELPERAAEFVENVRPKLVSVQEYANKHGAVSLAQFNMIQGIAGGLEKWMG